MAHLYAIQNHEPGEIAFVTKENKMMIWDEEKGWIEFAPTDKDFNTGLTLYDVNKNLINSMEPLTKEILQQKENLLNNYFKNANNNYHMLLCRDYNYYTLFAHNFLTVKPDFVSAVLGIVEELGPVYSVDATDDGAIEIWIKPKGENNPYAFYLFPYDSGVVYYG